MKRLPLMFVVLSVFTVAGCVQAQPERRPDRPFDRGPWNLRAEDLRVIQLEFSPDPVREGQRVSFRLAVLNRSQQSGRVDLVVKDRDEMVTEAKDVMIRPGENRIHFPETYYRFSRSDHCFIVEADIDRTRRRIDLANDFCARKIQGGWTLMDRGIGPLFVEDLDMKPDPASPGQEVRFRVRLRNDGRSVRGEIRIHDRDQLVVRVENVVLPPGRAEFQFPFTHYSFQRSDHCFRVVVDIDKTRYPLDAAREFCAKPVGWTLR